MLNLLQQRLGEEGHAGGFRELPSNSEPAGEEQVLMAMPCGLSCWDHCVEACSWGWLNIFEGEKNSNQLLLRENLERSGSHLGAL